MAEVSEIRLDDPTKFVITILEEDPANPNNWIPVDLSGFGGVDVRFQAPDGVSNIDRTAVIVDAPNGIVEASLATGELDQLENWNLQATVTPGTGGPFRTDIESFYVHENL